MILKLILAFFLKWQGFLFMPTCSTCSFVLVTNVIIFQSIIICFSFYYEGVFCFALRLESPTRSLIMEAPRGVQLSAAAGDFKATCRKELHLQSTEGEVSPQGQKPALYCWAEWCFSEYMHIPLGDWFLRASTMEL